MDRFTRIRQYNLDQGWMPDSYQEVSDRPFTHSAPATEAQIRLAEAALGCTLPEHLRTLLQTAGNGGFGPAYGIAGVHGGFPVIGIGGTLEQSSQLFCAQKKLVDYTQYEQQSGVFLLPSDLWSARLLPFADLGCVRTVMIDVVTGEVFCGAPINCSLYRLHNESESLSGWLANWLYRGINQVAP